jgi:hypothetical protein
MRTGIRLRWQGAKCVEAPPGRGHAVSLSTGVNRSWDDQIAVEPGHGVGQGQVIHHFAPESGRIDAAPPFRKAAAQKERECLAARVEPIPPAPHGAPVEAARTAGIAAPPAGLPSRTSGAGQCIAAAGSRCGDSRHSRNGRSERDCANDPDTGCDQPCGDSSRGATARLNRSAGSAVAGKHRGSVRLREYVDQGT